jgi:hypothetical protein
MSFRCRLLLLGLYNDEQWLNQALVDALPPLRRWLMRRLRGTGHDSFRYHQKYRPMFECDGLEIIEPASFFFSFEIDHTQQTGHLILQHQRPSDVSLAFGRLS